MKHSCTILLACLFCGCVYFNTFYNTKKLFNEAKKEREKRQGDEITNAEITKYDQTIEKASKILELHPNSKYVDDAVWILGECFYHKRDYVKAQRKFEELTKYFPDSEYYYPAKLWLAKTSVELKDYIGARFQLNELLDNSEVREDIREESRFLLGEIQYDQDYILEAEKAYLRVVEDGNNKKIVANAYLKLGLCQVRLEYYQDAVESFKNAMDKSPTKKFRFEATLNYARAFKLSHEFGSAKQVCENLLQNEDYTSQHGLVKLEYADCLYQEGMALNRRLRGTDLTYLGKIEQALDEYKKVTLEYKKTEVAAQAYFEIARIYDEDIGDYTSAKEHYEKVKLEYPKSELVEVANRKSSDIAELARLVGMVKKSQGVQLPRNGIGHSRFSELELVLLEHGVHPELRFLRKRQKLAQSESVEAQPDTGKVVETAAEVELLIANKLQLAEAYMFQFGQIDSALAQYDEIIEEFPDHPSTAKAIYSKAFIYENEFQDKDKTDSLLYLLVHRFPNSYQAEEARRILGLPLKNIFKDPAEQLFKTAEATLHSDKNTEKAIQEFENIVRKYPKSAFAPKALYALGWIFEKVKSENERALEIYQSIIKDYPESEYAKHVKKKIDAALQPPAEEAGNSSPDATNGNEDTDLTASDLAAKKANAGNNPRKPNNQ